MRSIVIIAEENLLRDLLVLAISGYPKLDLVAKAGNDSDGYDLCLKHNPDLVIINLTSPSSQGYELISRLKKRLPRQNVLICASLTYKSALRKLIRIGITGYIHTSASLDELEKAIKQTAVGNAYFNSDTEKVIHEFIESKESYNRDRLESITKREREIIILVAEAYTNKEIAIKLGMSARTADTHRANILKKLQLPNSVALTRWAVTKDLVSTIYSKS